MFEVSGGGLVGEYSGWTGSTVVSKAGNEVATVTLILFIFFANNYYSELSCSAYERRLLVGLGGC